MNEPVKAFDLSEEKKKNELAQERAIRTFARTAQARGTRQIISKPNDNVNAEFSAFSRYTKEQIMGFMQNPSANAKQLRDASNYMADVSTQYNRLLEHYANLYTWAYTVSPVAYSGASQKTAQKSYWDSLAFLEKMNLAHTAPSVIKTALREGVFFGVVWIGSNVVYVQKINPDYCRLTHIVDGTWQYSVDMSKIKENRLELYPPEFTAMWNEYNRSGLKWQEVPSQVSFCVKADETVVAYALPPFAATLGLLYDIEQYKALQETSTVINNYKLLNMKIPLNEDGTPQVDWTLANQYYTQLCNNVDAHIGVTISPMELEDFDFEHSGATDQVDIVARAEDGYWAANGTSALLHGSASNNSAGALKLSIRSDEAFIKPMVRQIELIANRLLRDQGSATQKYKINILPVTIFNFDEMLKLYKEAATLGIPGAKSAYAAILGTGAFDVLGLNMTELEYLQFDELVPLQSGYTMGGNADEDEDEKTPKEAKKDAPEGEAGRPEIDEKDLSESGEETRATSANDNR